MNVLLSILLNVIFPVFALLAAGVFFHRKFKFDLHTLSKITTFYLLPTVGFVNIYNSDIDGKVFLEIIGYQLLLSLILMILSAGIAKMMKLDKGMTANFKNSIVLMNSGNYGLPVSQLVFQSNPLGMTIQIIIMAIQNFITYTYGLLNSVAVNSRGREAVLEFLKMPMLYALLLGLAFQTFHVNIPPFLWNPIENVANAFLAIALLALGAQVAYIKLGKFDLVLFISCLGRLVISPIIALILIYLLGLEGTLAKALFIASSYPSSRNSAQLALEYNNYPEHAGQTVLVSTLLSAITVTFVVYLAGVLF